MELWWLNRPQQIDKKMWSIWAICTQIGHRNSEIPGQCGDSLNSFSSTFMALGQVNRLVILTGLIYQWQKRTKICKLVNNYGLWHYKFYSSKNEIIGKVQICHIVLLLNNNANLWTAESVDHILVSFSVLSREEEKIHERNLSYQIKQYYYCWKIWIKGRRDLSLHLTL